MQVYGAFILLRMWYITLGAHLGFFENRGPIDKKGIPKHFIEDMTFESLFQIGGNAAGGLLIQPLWSSMILVAICY